jgi:hypothetical protein
LLASDQSFMLRPTRKRVEAKNPVPQKLGTAWDGWSQWRNRLPPKQGGGCARGDKQEGFAQEVRRRHPPLGGRGQERRVDRLRPGYQRLLGAVLPLAQRHLPQGGGLHALRARGVLLPRGRARVGRTRGVVRPGDRLRPALAEEVEEHREGGAAPDAYQDRPPQETRGRRSPTSRQRNFDFGGYPFHAIRCIGFPMSG